MTSESIGELHVGGTSAFFLLTFEMVYIRKTTLTFLIQIPDSNNVIEVLSNLSINVQTILKSLRKT